MSVISYEVPINAQRMTIGVQGENKVREFLFDVTEWRQITGNIGAAEMVVQRNGDSSPYATVITMKDENTVSWIPTDTDTAKAGAGKIELMWIANNQTIKTKIFLMKVDPSLPYAVPDDSLDPWASWMPNLLNADARVKSLETKSSALQSSLAQEVANRSSGDALLQTQIDQLVAPSGEAPSAAEVQNARVGLDGVTYDTLGEAIRGQVGNLKNDLVDFNAYDYLLAHSPISKVERGVTWTANADHSVTAVGTATSTTINNLFTSANTLPDWVVPGKTYKVLYQAETVQFRVLVYLDGNTSTPTNILYTTADAEFTVPENTTGMIIRYAVTSGDTANETVRAIILNAETNSVLQGRVDALETELLNYDPLNVLSGIPKTDSEGNGITFTWDDAGYCTVKGTATSTTWSQIFNSPNALPSWAVPGGTYRYEYSSEYVTFYIYPYYNGTLGSALVETMTSGSFVLPDNVSGLLIRLTVRSGQVGVTINETVRPALTLQLKVNRLIEYLPAALNSPILGYYSDFQSKNLVVSTPPLSLNSQKSTIRRSAIITTESSYDIVMTNSDYVFRLYWYDENDALHSTAWARNWKIPKGCTVGITIKRADEGSFSGDENPQYYLRAYNDSPKDYYLDEIDSVVGRVKAANTEPGLCFLLSTDQHTMSAQGTLVKYDTISDMVVNMKELAKHINFDANISLGDIADFKVGDDAHFANYGILDNADYPALDSTFYDWMEDAVDKLSSVHPNFIYVPGNHDDNRYINKDVLHAATSAYDYSPGEMYSYYTQRSQLRRVPNTDNNGLDYYVDFPDFKIRMFCLDSNHYYDDEHPSPHGYYECWWYGYQDSTVTWLLDQLALVPSDWSVIICSHLSPIQGHNLDNVNYINMTSIAQAIQDFIDGGGNYICTLYGHNHADWSAETPWLEVCFNSQKCTYVSDENEYPESEIMPGLHHPKRVAGTATEDSWSIVIVQPKSRKVKAIRFGAGEDREFSY